MRFAGEDICLMESKYERAEDMHGAGTPSIAQKAQILRRLGIRSFTRLWKYGAKIMFRGFPLSYARAILFRKSDLIMQPLRHIFAIPEKSRFHPYLSDAARISAKPCAYARSFAANIASLSSSTFTACDSISTNESE